MQTGFAPISPSAGPASVPADLVDDDRLEVIDFKTDLDRSTAAVYRTQVSVYHYVVAAAVPDRDVADRRYTYHGTASERIDPLSIPELEQLVGALQRVRAA